MKIIRFMSLASIIFFSIYLFGSFWSFALLPVASDLVPGDFPPPTSEALTEYWDLVG
jgi:hypothetical protein